jgi:hypothetical protein
MEGAGDRVAWGNTNNQRSVPTTRSTLLEKIVHCAPWAKGCPQLDLHPAKAGRAVVRRTAPAGQRGKMSRDRATAGVNHLETIGIGDSEVAGERHGEGEGLTAASHVTGVVDPQGDVELGGSRRG